MSHDIELDRPRLRVDFNELVCRDLVLVSAEDHKMDSSGTSIQMVEELHVLQRD